MRDLENRKFKDEKPLINRSEMADRISACINELIRLKKGFRPKKEDIIIYAGKYNLDWEFIRKLGGWEPPMELDTFGNTVKYETH